MHIWIVTNVPASSGSSPSLEGPTESRQRNFLSVLKEVPIALKGLSAATSAVLALLVSHLYVPDQLRYLPKSSFGLAALAVLASWVWYHPLRQRIGTVVVAATLMLVTLILLNQRFVRSVPENAPDPTPYLIGTDLSPFGKQVSKALGNPSDEVIIEQAGYDEIPKLWINYREVSLGYTAVFCCFVFAGALAVSGGLSYVPGAERS